MEELMMMDQSSNFVSKAQAPETDLASRKLIFVGRFDSYIYLKVDKKMNLFSYTNFCDYLSEIRKNYPATGKAISLERWSKKLGYKSPRSVAMVLNGQRLPTPDMVMAFSKDLGHSPKERRYFELLVLREKMSQKGEVPPEILEELTALNPRVVELITLRSDVFSYIAEWYHLVIKQLIASENFSEEDDWLFEKLQGKVSREDIRSGIETMLKLELIQRNPETGDLKVNDDQSLITPADIPSMATRKHLIQQMERAKEAIEEQGLMDREFTTVTFQVDRSKFEAAKNAIRDFRDQFEKDFCLETSDDIGQLNIQFFCHTHKE